ncbi:hypothetical protein ACFYWY_22210 [Streptomyces sp. NPDC002870]|uniref:hypothetical protein n=1 Tax=Streptomyces sp. NPDC002870 TaxID=3364666 RepID=UPI0036B1F0E8
MLRELARRRGREAALMPVVFTSAIGLGDGGTGRRAEGRLDGFGITQTPQVFIDCQAMDDAEGLQVNWDVRDGVFPDGFVDDMFDVFDTLIRGHKGAAGRQRAEDVVHGQVEAEVGQAQQRLTRAMATADLHSGADTGRVAGRQRLDTPGPAPQGPAAVRRRVVHSC